MEAEDQTLPQPGYDGSEPLKNERHETFAQLVSTSMELAKAYRAAGYTTKNPRVAASNGVRLSKEPSVAKRLEFLRPKVDEVLERWMSQPIVSAISDRVERIRG